MKKGFYFTFNSHFTASVCRQLSRLGLVAALVVGSWSFGAGQQSITTGNYQQTFDAIGTTSTAALPTGFKFGVAGGTLDWTNASNTTAATQAAGTSGTGILTSSSSGGAYNFANGITGSATDRALGFITTGSYASPDDIFFAFTNNTGSTVSSLYITFDYEKYRSGSRQVDWNFFHGATSTSVNTAATTGDQSYVADADNTVVSNPPTTISKAVSLTGLSIANGTTYYLRWRYTGLAGSTNAQGIGIDNFSITTGTPYYWNGANVAATPAAGGTGTWGTTNAWRTQTTTGAQATFTNSVSAIFAGTAGTVTVDATRAPNNTTFNTTGYILTSSTAVTVSGLMSVGSGIGLNLQPTASTLSLSGIISGAGTLTKDGAGALTLGGANTYSGGFTLNTGTVNVGNGGAFGAGSMTINGGSIDQTAFNGTTNLTTNITQTWAGDFTYLGSTGSGYILNMGTGAVSLTGNRMVTVSAATFTVGGVISGAFGLTKAGAGTLSLTGTNTYTGKTAINAGIVSLSAETRLGAAPASFTADQITLNGGTILSTGSFGFSSNRGFTLGASGGTFNAPTGNTITLTSVTTGSGPLTKDGVGTLAMTGAHTYTGLTTVTAGTLQLNKSGGGTLPSTNNVTVANGGTLLVSTNQTLNNLTVAAGGTVTVSSGVTLTINGTYSVSSNTSGNAGTILINGTLQLNEGGWPGNTGTFTYGASGTLVFANTTGPYGVGSGDTWFPSSSGPANVTVQGGGGINLNSISRTVPSSGTTGTFLLVTGTNAVQGNALTLNGTVQINGGNFSSTPIYGSSSTLIYNTGMNYGISNEWTAGNGGSSVTVGTGIPNNVTIQSGTTVTLSGARGLAGNMTVTGTLDLSGSGDLYIGGSFAQNGTFTNGSNKGLFFVGATATQTISASGGTVAIPYFIINKSTGTVQLSSTTPTNVTIASTAGDELQLLGAGTLDLNGRTLTFSGAGGNILASGGARSITSSTSGATLNINGSKTVTSASSGTLSIGANVTTILTAGMDFGSALTTINGTLQLNSGGFVNTNTPTYANSSTLIYNNPAGYTVGIEWGSGTTTGAGVPNNVTVLQGTVVLPASARSVPGTLTMTSGALTLTNGGNLTVSTTLALSASKITTNNAKVILPSSASLTRSTGYVVGNLQKNVATGANVLRTFEIGDASNYTPLSITFANVSTAGDVTASTTASVHPNVGTSSLHATKFINRYWTLSSVSTAFDTYQAVFTYVSGDVQGSANTSNLIIGRYASSAWTYPSVSNSGFTTTGTGLTAFGDFALAENGCVNPTAYTVTGGGAYCSGGTGVAIGLSNSETGVTYQLILGVANDGSPISGTGAISFGLKTTAGTYTVLGTRTSGGCSTAMTGNAVVSINARPTESHTKVDDNCQVNAGSITITVSGGLAPYSIVWSSGGLPNGNISTSGGTLTVSSLTGGVSYIFTATDNNGCTAQ